MQFMLSAHPEIHCIETRPWGNKYIPFERERYHLNIDHYAQFLHQLMNLPEPNNETDIISLTESIHESVLSWTRAKTGKRIVGEKCTPYAGCSMSAIERYHAQRRDVPLIHLVRDPRDVVVSLFVQYTQAHPSSDEVERKHHEECLQNRRIPDEVIGWCVDFWHDVTQAASRAEDLFKNYIEIRYEDLVADTPGVLRKVLRHINADDALDVVRTCVESATFKRLSGRPRGDEDRSSFFRKGIVGDYANWLSPAQEQVVLDAAGPHFNRLYPAHVPAGASADT